MKKISILIACYNEKDNIRQICEAVKQQMAKLTEYDYEIVLIDNKSEDGTREIIRELCHKEKRIKAIFNLKNFGQFNSPYYGLLQTTGDCVIKMVADFQDPPELIPELIHHWEAGNKVICMVKTSSKESKLMYWIREQYYSLLKKMSDVRQIKQFTGFGLYDRSFIELLKSLNEPLPFLRGMVAEYAPDHLEIPYTQPARKAGNTHNNFYSLYDAAMLSFTSYTKGGLRIITFGGFIIAMLSFLIALIYFLYKLTHWNTFNAGIAPVTIGVFFVGGLQLASLGFIGEYILSMNQRIMRKPLVIEEERINFEKHSE